MARSPKVHSPQAGERSRLRSVHTLAQVGQKLTGTASTTSICAQNASRKTSQSISALRLAAMQKVSVGEGGAQEERRQMPIVTTMQAIEERANTQPCGAPGFTAA